MGGCSSVLVGRLLLVFAAATVVACGSRQAGAGGAADGDRDGDHIIDRCDRCPDRPETYNLTEDEDGCPERVVVETSRHASVRTVYFPRNGAAPSRQIADALGFIASELRAQEAESIACIGEASGDEADAVTLSQARAEMVCRDLRIRGAARKAEAHGLGARGAAHDTRDPDHRRVVTVVQLSARLREQWYAPLYVFGRWDRDHVEVVDRLTGSPPSGPARCPRARRTVPPGPPRRAP